jgi:hypothetical protein
MTEDHTPDDQTSSETSPETPSAEQLHEQNQQLRQRIEEMEARNLEADRSLEQFETLQQQNDNLRRSYASAALDQALRAAADKLGISPETASLYAHRFQCTLDDDAAPRISPNPTELLVDELKSNPLLATSEARRKRSRQTDAAAAGLVDPESLDAGDLLAQLDRSPNAKARFIARHGGEAYLKMAEKARGASAG